MSYNGPFPQTVKEGGTGANALTGVLTGNGTSAFTASTVTNHGVLVGGASNSVGSTGVGSTGQVLQGNTGANPTYSTATYPSIATGTGTILRADGTNWVATTATYPATTTVNQILFSSAANVVGGITAGIDGVLISNHATGVPSWLANSATPGFILTANAGAPPSWQASAASSITLTGDTGGGLTGNSFTFNAHTNSGSSVFFTGTGTTLSLKVTDANNNTIIGSGAGNGSITGITNVGLGDNVLAANGAGGHNTAIGSDALQSATAPESNIAIGKNAGSNYATTESSNILIGSNGTLGDTNKIRIGIQGATTGQQNACFIAGITGVTTNVANRQLVTVNSSTTQVGTSAFSVVKQIFTSSGTYTPTSGMVYCILECVGGGGAGGGSGSASAGFQVSAGGGGGGGYARLVASSATIGASQTVTVGAAGTAGTAGNNPGGNGGDTSVGSLCIGKGGTGGGGSTGGAVAAGGAGGVAGTGDITFPGQQGMGGGFLLSSSGSGTIAGGGNSYFGTGGNPVTLSASNGTGTAGSLYGGGGGAGMSFNAGGNVAGAAGAKGVVFITEYVIA